MKIAMLGQKRIPSREGGVEIVVEELSTRMVKLGHEVTCYNRGGKHALDKNVETSNEKEYKGVKLSKCFTIDKKGLAAMTSSFFATIKAIFSKNEVIHYHAEGPCAWMWLVKWFTNKKIVATIHGLDWQRAKWGGFATQYIKFGEKCAVKYADEIIVLSKNVQQYFKDTYNRETVFIPNGVNKPEIVKADIIEKEYNLKKDDYILFLGRIVPEKGIHYLIDAYNEAKVDKKLVIAGGASDTDTYYSELTEKAKDNENIIFTGFVQGKTLEELYSNAYIYCLPSDLEGMPLSLLEGMSYKNCCLTSDIKECSEVVEDKAVTFQKGNVKDLTKKLKHLCDNKKEVQNYKKEAQEFITKKYNWDEVTTKTVELYKEKKSNNSVIKREIKKQGIITIILSSMLLILFMNFVHNKELKMFIYAITYIFMVISLLKEKKWQILSIPVFFSIYHAFYIGICPIFLLLNSYASPTNTHIQELINSNSFLNVQTSMILVSYLIYISISMVYGRKLNCEKKQEEIKTKKIKIKYNTSICVTMVLFALSMLVIYVFKNFDMLFGGNLESGRITAMSGNGILLSGMWLGTIGISLLFENLLRKETSLKLFLPLCLIYSVSILAVGFRSRLVTLLILLILIYNKYHKIKVGKTVVIGVALVALVCGLGVVRDFLSGIENSSILKTMINLFQNGAVNIHHILREFPNYTPYQYGKTLLINLKMALPGPDIDYTLWLKETLNVSFSGGGVTPTMLGDFYINFGPIGVYIGFAIIGILVNVLEWYYNNEKNTYFISFLIWCILASVRGGITNTELDFLIYTIVYVILLHVFKICEKNKRGGKSNEKLRTI